MFHVNLQRCIGTSSKHPTCKAKCRISPRRLGAMAQYTCRASGLYASEGMSLEAWIFRLFFFWLGFNSNTSETIIMMVLKLLDCMLLLLQSLEFECNRLDIPLVDGEFSKRYKLWFLLNRYSKCYMFFFTYILCSLGPKGGKCSEQPYHTESWTESFSSSPKVWALWWSISWSTRRVSWRCVRWTMRKKNLVVSGI